MSSASEGVFPVIMHACAFIACLHVPDAYAYLDMTKRKASEEADTPDSKHRSKKARTESPGNETKVRGDCGIYIPLRTDWCYRKMSSRNRRSKSFRSQRR